MDHHLLYSVFSLCPHRFQYNAESKTGNLNIAQYEKTDWYLFVFVLLEYSTKRWNYCKSGRVREKCSLPGQMNNRGIWQLVYQCVLAVGHPKWPMLKYGAGILPITLQNPMQNSEVEWWREDTSFLWIDARLRLLSGFFYALELYTLKRDLKQIVWVNFPLLFSSFRHPRWESICLTLGFYNIDI